MLLLLIAKTQDSSTYIIQSQKSTGFRFPAFNVSGIHDRVTPS